MVAAVFILAFLMISTIRYSSLKHLTLGKKSHLTVLVMALLLALVVYLSRPTLLALATAYVISGPASRLYGMIRRKKSGEEMTLPIPCSITERTFRVRDPGRPIA